MRTIKWYHRHSSMFDSILCTGKNKQYYTTPNQTSIQPFDQSSSSKALCSPWAVKASQKHPPHTTHPPLSPLIHCPQLYR
mmetsp:Transcript_4461/g.6762  ORF Transcript_4461/g.6762 Transcript_4461/m.6762 type:complete len:80 (-) Transcript_4461:827-1066(-)